MYRFPIKDAFMGNRYIRYCIQICLTFYCCFVQFLSPSLMYRFKRFDENGELLYLFLPPLSVTQPFVMFNLKELRVDNEGSRSVCLSVLQLCLSDSAFNLCV